MRVFLPDTEQGDVSDVVPTEFDVFIDVIHYMCLWVSMVYFRSFFFILAMNFGLFMVRYTIKYRKLSTISRKKN